MGIEEAFSDAAGHCSLVLVMDDPWLRRTYWMLTANRYDSDDPYECVGGES